MNKNEPQKRCWLTLSLPTTEGQLNKKYTEQTDIWFSIFTAMLFSEYVIEWCKKDWIWNM